jgi:hypothetical protein
LNVQIGVRKERLAQTTQHKKQYSIDVQCRGGNNGEACTRKGHVLGLLQASVRSGALVCGILIAQDDINWSEEDPRHQDGDGGVLRKKRSGGGEGGGVQCKK